MPPLLASGARRRASAITAFAAALLVVGEPSAEEPVAEPFEPIAPEELDPEEFGPGEIGSGEIEPAEPAAALEPVAPSLVSGIEEPGRSADDTGREIGNWLLFVPRNVVDYTFRGTQLAARFVADQQLVPRYREIFGAPGVDFFVFPTLFIETGSAASVGARMIADSRYVTTSQRVGYGGPEDVEVESRVVLKANRKVVPWVLSLEGYYKLEDDLEYWGVGITPKLDARNRFRTSAASDYGLYTERLVRGVASLGLRLTDDLELFLSTSLYRRQIASEDRSAAEALSAVFDEGSVPGIDASTFVTYAEIASRFDSRLVRTRPSPGLLVEGYLGGGRSVDGGGVAFARMGTRLAGFFPVYRRSNILSPRLVIDRVASLNGLELPFVELTRQPDFRGFDTRRDHLSMVASLDYTWQLVPFLGMRLFFDVATVAPDVADLDLHHLENARYAGGLGLDLFAGDSELASISVSMSPDGPRLLATFGVPSQYGDRQHRE